MFFAACTDHGEFDTNVCIQIGFKLTSAIHCIAAAFFFGLFDFIGGFHTWRMNITFEQYADQTQDEGHFSTNCCRDSLTSLVFPLSLERLNHLLCPASNM